MIKKIPIRKIRIGIRIKMLLSFSLVIALLIFFMSYFAVIKYSQKLESNNIRYSNQVISNLIENLNDYVEEVKNITNLVVYNQYVQKYLIQRKKEDMTEKTENLERIIDVFCSIINTRRDVSSIFLFSDSGLLLFKSTHLNIDTSFNYRNQSWYIKAIEADGFPVVTTPLQEIGIKENNNRAFCISRCIESFDGIQKLGVILLDINMCAIKDLCNSTKFDNNGFIFIIDGSGNTVYYPPFEEISYDNKKKLSEEIRTKVIPKMLQIKKGAFVSDLNNKKYQIVSDYMDKTDWIVAAITPYESMMADANRIKNLLIVVSLFSLALTFVITFWLSTKITKPIINLKNCVDKADHGNLDIRANIKTNDEIEMLANSFNNMLERIKKLMKQIVEEQEEKRKSELKALQAQINPHFLYNTLDSIIWMAENKNKNIVPMIEALSKFFRLSLNRGEELISLEDELDHVRNYLIIQSMRYLNKFDYEIHASEEVLKYKVPKIILQPLVENSIYHGIKNKRTKGHIVINAWKENEKLIISVSDDGIGMDPQMCEKIVSNYSSRNSSKGSGIGVYNVNERIKLYFGKKYGIKYESIPQIGTTAYIYLPLIK